MIEIDRSGSRCSGFLGGKIISRTSHCSHAALGKLCMKAQSLWRTQATCSVYVLRSKETTNRSSKKRRSRRGRGRDPKERDKGRAARPVRFRPPASALRHTPHRGRGKTTRERPVLADGKGEGGGLWGELRGGRDREMFFGVYIGRGRAKRKRERESNKTGRREAASCAHQQAGGRGGSKTNTTNKEGETQREVEALFFLHVLPSAPRCVWFLLLIIA